LNETSFNGLQHKNTILNTIFGAYALPALFLALKLGALASAPATAKHSK
jgi:hypothetical protein